MYSTRSVGSQEEPQHRVLLTAESKRHANRCSSLLTDHSSMMRPPQVQRVGEVVAAFVEDLRAVEAEMTSTTAACASKTEKQ